MASTFNHNGVVMTLRDDLSGSLDFGGDVYAVAPRGFQTQDEFKLWMERQAILLRQKLDAIASAGTISDDEGRGLVEAERDFATLRSEWAG